jgi:hypothetical protein
MEVLWQRKKENGQAMKATTETVREKAGLIEQLLTLLPLNNANASDAATFY